MASSGMGSGSAARAVSDAAGAREVRSDERGAEAPDTKTSCSSAGANVSSAPAASKASRTTTSTGRRAAMAWRLGRKGGGGPRAQGVQKGTSKRVPQTLEV
mmetsp:Transcript_28624/g.92011  ORF Transcript_28624/g.92011 Transcript_28624/m.92011 type:complete len:101 (+) Transcript_28624:281-583(+)